MKNLFKWKFWLKLKLDTRSKMSAKILVKFCNLPFATVPTGWWNWRKDVLDFLYVLIHGTLNKGSKGKVFMARAFHKWRHVPKYLRNGQFCELIASKNIAFSFVNAYATSDSLLIVQKLFHYVDCAFCKCA